MPKSSNIIERYNEKSNDALLVINEFKKPLFKNRLYVSMKGLILNASLINFNDITWNQNPQKFSLDHYGQYDFYPIILLMNNIHSMFLFNMDRFSNTPVIAPKINDILQTLSN